MGSSSTMSQPVTAQNLSCFSFTATLRSDSQLAKGVWAVCYVRRVSIVLYVRERETVSVLHNMYTSNITVACMYN